MTDPSFKQQLRDDATACVRFKGLLTTVAGPSKRLSAAMRYALLNGGKRMRVALVMGPPVSTQGGAHDAAMDQRMFAGGSGGQNVFTHIRWSMMICLQWMMRQLGVGNRTPILRLTRQRQFWPVMRFRQWRLKYWPTHLRIPTQRYAWR